MKIHVIPVAQLSSDHVSIWSRLQRSDRSLANPFFRPEFALAVAAERPGVDVAVLEQADEPVGFLPFERLRWGVGRAVGACINQFQGAIVRQDVPWEPREVVRAAKLRYWRFDHLAASQSAFAPYQYAFVESPYLDLSAGFEGYRKSRGKSLAKFVSHVFQKDRKAERDLGEVRLEVNPADHGRLKRLLDWKIEQCRQRHVRCVYNLDWIVRLHERLLDHSADDFAGMLFNLHMGGRLAASFFCLRSGGILQGSILGYDRELGAYAPGLVLLMRVAQMANSLGITRIDMGKGNDSYKRDTRSACDQVSEGSVLLQPSLAPLYRGWHHARDRLLATRLHGPLRRVQRWMFQARTQIGYTD